MPFQLSCKIEQTDMSWQAHAEAEECTWAAALGCLAHLTAALGQPAD